jgi:hypothetical protein
MYDYHVADNATIPHIAVSRVDDGGAEVERVLDIYDTRNVDLAEAICARLNGQAGAS